MQMYVVERFVVGWTDAEIRALLDREHGLRDAMADEGVRLLGSIVMPSDEMCLSFFDGPDPDTVVAANAHCELPVDRVLEAVTSIAGTPWGRPD